MEKEVFPKQGNKYNDSRILQKKEKKKKLVRGYAPEFSNKNLEQNSKMSD